MNNARRAGRTLPLYNETRTLVIRQLSPIQLNDLAAQQKIAWFKTAKGKDAVCLIVAPFQSRKYSPAIHDSPASITPREMFLNAGMSEDKRIPGFNLYEHRDFDIVGNGLDAAKTKIETWPGVTDSKNVGVCAGSAYGVTSLDLPLNYLNFA
jgi:hypothetical protein